MAILRPRLGEAAARMQRPLRHIILESFLIALGVVLALFGQQWRAGREARAVAQTALSSIRSELVQNRERLAESAEYHTAKIELIQGYFTRAATEPDAHPSPRDFERGFIAPAQLLEVAWQTARETDALRKLPYEDLLSIAAIYQAQEAYRIQAERSGELIYQDIYEVGPDGLARKYRSVYTLLYAFLYRERGEHSLQPQYTAAIATIDRMLGEPAVVDSTTSAG